MIFAEAAIAGMTLVLIYLQWISTGRARRGIPGGLGTGFSTLLQSCQIGLFGVCLVLGCAASWGRLHGRLPFGAALTLAAALSALVISYLLLPPALVVLGRSGAATRSIVRRLAWAVFPLRTAHLFHANPLSDPVSFVTGLRNRDASKWRQSVRDLMRGTALVAVDARDVSPAVVAEALASLGPDSVERVVFAVDSPDESVLLNAVLSEVQVDLPHVRTATPRQIERWLRGVGWRSLGGSKWSAGRPIGAVLLAQRRRWSRPTPQDGTPRLCSEARARLAQGISADDLTAHVQVCPVCRFSGRRYFPTSGGRSTSGPAWDGPKVVCVGVEGPPPLWDILSRADAEDAAIVILIANSPAAQQPQWVLDALRAMESDPRLFLIVEDDRISALPLDPCIVVRTDHLRRQGGRIPAVTLRELAERLVQAAEREGLGVRRIPLVEIPPDGL